LAQAICLPDQCLPKCIPPMAGYTTKLLMCIAVSQLEEQFDAAAVRDTQGDGLTIAYTTAQGETLSAESESWDETACSTILFAFGMALAIFSSLARIIGPKLSIYIMMLSTLVSVVLLYFSTSVKKCLCKSERNHECSLLITWWLVSLGIWTLVLLPLRYPNLCARFILGFGSIEDAIQARWKWIEPHVCEENLAFYSSLFFSDLCENAFKEVQDGVFTGFDVDGFRLVVCKVLHDPYWGEKDWWFNFSLNALTREKAPDKRFIEMLSKYCAYFMERYRWTAPLHYHFQALQIPPSASLGCIEKKYDLSQPWISEDASKHAAGNNHIVFGDSLQVVRSYVLSKQQAKDTKNQESS